MSHMNHVKSCFRTLKMHRLILKVKFESKVNLNTQVSRPWTPYIDLNLTLRANLRIFKSSGTTDHMTYLALTWLDLIWPFRYCVRPNASTVPPNGEAIIKVMLQPGGTDERHKFMVQSIYGKFWPYLTSNDLMYKPIDTYHHRFYFSSPLYFLIWPKYHHF